MDAMLLLRPELDALAVDLPGHGHSDWFDDPLYLPEERPQSLAGHRRDWDHARDAGRPLGVG